MVLKRFYPIIYDKMTYWLSYRHIESRFLRCRRKRSFVSSFIMLSIISIMPAFSFLPDFALYFLPLPNGLSSVLYGKPTLPSEYTDSPEYVIPDVLSEFEVFGSDDFIAGKSTVQKSRQSTLDLVRNPAYILRNFSIEYTNYSEEDFQNSEAVYVPEDQSWADLYGVFPGLERRKFLSVRKHDLQEFTLAFFFRDLDFSEGSIYGLLLAGIGQNWEVYLNGNRVRKEMYVQDGSILKDRTLRNVSIPLNPKFFEEGENLLLIRLVTHPDRFRPGFFFDEPYRIDTLDNLVDHHEKIITVFFGLFLFSSLFHLYLYLSLKKDLYYLLFGALSFLIVIFFISRSHFLVIPVLDTYWIRKTEFLSLFLVLPFYIAFIHSALEVGSRWISF